jgi:SAM-dependent methyltransferase
MTETTPNAEQIAYWNGDAAARWVRRQEEIDAMLTPFTEALLGAAGLRRDAPRRVLDVGCGSGETALWAAYLGHDVTGLDVSAPLLDLARERASEAGIEGVTFIQADASRTFIDPPFDLVMSRFGVMFFEDPAKAFANLSRITAPGGRIVFTCWRAPAFNAWVTTPIWGMGNLAKAEAFSPGAGPGPFAFADAGRVTRLLTGAGYEAVRVTPLDAPMAMGGTGVEEAGRYLSEIGPTARVLASLDEDLREVALARVRRAIKPHMAGDTLVLDGAIWVVEGRKPA